MITPIRKLHDSLACWITDFKGEGQFASQGMDDLEAANTTRINDCQVINFYHETERTSSVQINETI